ncbi:MULTISPECIES: LysR family transcriptional regulator [Acetobacter]|uniref:LysR family transcriptional regulator n=2 Tax=Acetobacter TaxID=434 RepID=A0AAN1PH36_9PROT|nr:MULTISPECIES: LysR family transcriptional regulator [Acetobacter]ASL40511.1 LysR family transcriptional regulator [Acetobacter oryzifermentans]AXN00148.1 LysR family transcriptional regulator [Acetobacter pomorum]KAA8392868.1 LysR family transcriptional regulator [Acetobacter sp. DmW_125124]KAA8395378.1 LysR family transcriptional regulator [Acetobacter sp. DmW_125128]KAA8400082.1 LysR family transcriptional regulator [Acetobacter sp. DmW_125127]
MARENLNDLTALVAVARVKSFTKAAAKLGVSQSALSHTIRLLEERLDLRLLTRTTRSVTPTTAGQQLISGIAPHLDQIENQLTSLGELRNQESGNLRITMPDDALAYVVLPKIKEFVQKYPKINVEFVADLKLIDIFSEDFDGAIRLGENITKEMTSVPITPDIRFVVAGSPEYFSKNPKPKHPKDLLNHNCLTLRLPTHGRIYAWEFEKKGKDITVKVEGSLIFNSIFPIRDACLEGLGLAHMPEMVARKYIQEGRLLQVLEDWCPYWSGYHLCFPRHHENVAPLSLFIDEMRLHKSNR